jgi:hypothetical protein
MSLRERTRLGQTDNSHMFRHAMGALYVIATWTALALVYNAIIDYKHYWPQGLLGLALGGVALLIYRRWFVGWHWRFAAGTIGALAVIAAIFAAAELLRRVLVLVGQT